MSLLYHVEDEEAYSRPKHTRRFNLFCLMIKQKHATTRVTINKESK